MLFALSTVIGMKMLVMVGANVTVQFRICTSYSSSPNLKLYLDSILLFPPFLGNQTKRTKSAV